MKKILEMLTWQYEVTKRDIMKELNKLKGEPDSVCRNNKHKETVKMIERGYTGDFIFEYCLKCGGRKIYKFGENK